MSNYTLVEQPGSISQDLAQLDRIGVDTEFMRERTFFAELSLVQVATGAEIYCVDPLADNAMQEFWETMTDKTWVVHSARQDIEVIYQSARLMPKTLFDTQIAAGLLGLAPQLGYASLVKELFDVDIAKTHTRADWSKRPLADALLQYAAEDVLYLLPAYERLAEALDHKGRLDWASEDSAQLLDPALYDVDPTLAIGRLKGARNLRGRSRAAAARLAAWREKQALQSNRPRQWIVKDTALVSLAVERPSSAEDLQQIDGLAPGFLRRSGRDILATIRAAATDSNDYRPPARPDESQKALLKQMQQEVATCAADLGLAAETVASKRDLSAIIIGGDRDTRLLNSWRRELIGERLLELL